MNGYTGIVKISSWWMSDMKSTFILFGFFNFLSI